MSERINVKEILEESVYQAIKGSFPDVPEDKVRASAWFMLNMDTDTYKGIAEGIKIIVEAVLSRAAEEATLKYPLRDDNEVYKPSILKIKEDIMYD